MTSSEKALPQPYLMVFGGVYPDRDLLLDNLKLMPQITRWLALNSPSNLVLLMVRPGTDLAALVKKVLATRALDNVFISRITEDNSGWLPATAWDFLTIAQLKTELAAKKG